MKIQINKEFETREGLDSYIRSSFGENENHNKDITLELTQAELDKLLLSESSKIYGTKIKKA